MNKDSKWNLENKKFFELIDWFKKYKNALINKINIGFLYYNRNFRANI